METLINKILKILKAKVKQNVKEIEYLQDEINTLLSEPASSFKTQELEIKYSLNKELLGENEDFIQMQLELNEFMEKYSHLFTEEEINGTMLFESPEEKEDVNFFDRTITGELHFDPAHPQFNNQKFFEDLLEYYKAKEDYEKCHELIKMKERR